MQSLYPPGAFLRNTEIWRNLDTQIVSKSSNLGNRSQYVSKDFRGKVRNEARRPRTHMCKYTSRSSCAIGRLGSQMTEDKWNGVAKLSVKIMQTNQISWVRKLKCAGIRERTSRTYADGGSWWGWPREWTSNKSSAVRSSDSCCFRVCTTLCWSIPTRLPLRMHQLGLQWELHVSRIHALPLKGMLCAPSRPNRIISSSWVLGVPLCGGLHNYAVFPTTRFIFRWSELVATSFDLQGLVLKGYR